MKRHTIPSKWYIGCSTPEDKTKRKEFLMEQKYLLGLLKEILEKDLHILDKEMSSTKRYDDQSWAYRQADYLGSKRVYEEIIKLLTIGDQNV